MRYLFGAGATEYYNCNLVLWKYGAKHVADWIARLWAGYVVTKQKNWLP